MDDFQHLLKTLDELSASEKWSTYVNPTFSIRCRSKIYDCYNGTILQERDGKQLHKEDMDSDCDDESEYPLSTLIPNNDEERIIIDKYNQLVSDRRQLRRDELDQDHQNMTMMILYSRRQRANGLPEMLENALNMGIRRRYEVEGLKVGGLLYFSVVFYDHHE